MIKILFICHGNICRSPMAEYLMKYKLEKLNLENKYEVSSKATSREEIGNHIHYGTRKILDMFNIDYHLKVASQISEEDVLYYDYIIAMDHYNLVNLEHMFGKNKKFRLLNEKDIADPWYTGDFNTTYKEIDKGLDDLINELEKGCRK